MTTPPDTTTLVDFPEGGYRYLKGVFQYSGGVTALPGFAIDRLRFADTLPLAEGFDAIAAHLQAIGRPLTALCACELRSPAPFSELGFERFNRHYAATLERWQLLRGERNPVARTNVCPVVDVPAEPGFYAFSYTVEDDADAAGGPGDFVVSGGGEARDGQGSYRDGMVALGDTTPEGLRAKLRYVVGEMQRRVTALGHGWRDASAVQAYTVHDIGALVADEVMAPTRIATGLNWHLTRPPIVDMEIEMDLRRVRCERIAPRP